MPKLSKERHFFLCCALLSIAGLLVFPAVLLAQTAAEEAPPAAPEIEEKVLPDDGEKTPEAETPPEETESPDAGAEGTEAQQEKSPDGLDPEQMDPEPGIVIGDGDEMVMQDNLVQIHGNALIKYGDMILRADHVWADFNENLLRASGNVHLITGAEETFSDELIFNLETKKGIARNGFTYNDPWYFGGSDIFKIGDKKSYIRSATLTTCSLKYPHYYFSVSRVIVRVNEEMIAKNIVLRIGGFPLFYFPAIRRDLRKGKVAKIIVKVGTDSYQGPYVSIILPIARKRRYDGALLYDESARRGRGFGFEGKYRFNDTQFREIYIPIPPDATPAQRTKLEEKAKEIHERLEGEHDRYWLKQLFLPYEITADDVNRAEETAAELLMQLTEEGADFATLAQRNSDHETRYEGGDLGFIVRGERIEEKTPATSKTQNAPKEKTAPDASPPLDEAATPEGTPIDAAPETGAAPEAAESQDAEAETTQAPPAEKPKLDPILEEAAFELEEGEISSVLKTESAFHILKVERVLDVYGEREIQLRRIDIAIAASDETQQKLRETTDIIQARALEGESFERLAAAFAEVTLSEVNDGDGLPLSEMDASWRYSVRRLEEPGDITQRRPVSTPEGLYLFQLIEKEETPTFEVLAEELDAEWELFLAEVMSSTEEPKAGEQTSAAGASVPAEGASPESPETAEVSSDTPEPKSPEAEVPAESRPKDAPASSDEAVGEDASSDEAEDVDAEEPFTVYRKHGYRGRWEDPRAVASEAQSLYGGEFSKVIPTKKAFRLIKVDKKRAYRGDIYLYRADHYSFDRQSPSRIGRRWNMRWGHRQSLYTPWDSRREGRRPISFTGRTELRALTYKEELKLPGESTLNTFGILTYGAAFSALDEGDRDDNGNLRFSRQPTGDFTGRLEVRHIHDFTGEGTTSLQKLPQLTLNFSRMRFNGLPVFRTINSRLVTLSEKSATEKPILSLFTVPTLENTSFDLDIELGNFYRQVYKSTLVGDERDVFLQTMDLGFDLRKQSTLLITPLRELLLNMNFNTNMIWHDQDQEKNRNIVRGVYSFRGSATNTLFRVYNINFIPRMRKLRHEMQSTVTFDYQPPVDENKNLYPFGPSTYFYERKSLSYNFDTNIEIKTQRSQSPHRVLQLRTQLRADFTEFDPLYKRRYEPIESNLTFIPLPSRSLNVTVRLTHDPNPDPDDDKTFKMVGLRSNIRYTRQSWNVSIGSSFSKRLTSRQASRSITASGRYRFSENLDFDINLIYYPIDGQFYSQRLSINRNLHDWNLRISWSRVGIKRGEPPYNNVRQDFTFQISLIPEPAVSMGVGYDATTDTWGLRTLSAGSPYNAFGVGNSLGRSYF